MISIEIYCIYISILISVQIKRVIKVVLYKNWKSAYLINWMTNINLFNFTKLYYWSEYIMRWECAIKN
jgi:hypothetical protein